MLIPVERNGSVETIDLVPSKIIGIGQNYRAHAAEMGKGLPEEPLMFLKPRSALSPVFVTPDELFANPMFAPDRVRSLSAPDLQAMWRDRVAQAPDSELEQIQADMLAGRQSAENLQARFIGVIEATLCPPLPVPQERIVIIDCADDPIIPPTSRQAVRDRYPQAEAATLPTGGHYPHILNPEAYDAVIVRRLGT